MTWSLESVLPCRRQLELENALNAVVRGDEVPPLAREIRRFLQEIASQDLGGHLLSRLISGFNDRLSQRVIALTAARHRLPAVTWCWLALGSEGRHEQTFISDQDNGLIFSAADDREAEDLRQRFLPFAQEVNARLAECGFSLCTGGIMAGNPQWCLSFDEWRYCFIEWVRRPEPQALLNASIFFDLRALYGESDLAERLRSLLLSMTVDTPSFLHLMAANALQAEPPLNFFGEVVGDASGKGGEAGEVVDLKKFGSRIFVDAARIFALSVGARAVNTRARFYDAGPAIGLPPEEIVAVDAAFSQILRLRLQNQSLPGRFDENHPNLVRLAALNDVDRAILREALRQARRLHHRLKVNYGL